MATNPYSRRPPDRRRQAWLLAAGLLALVMVFGAITVWSHRPQSDLAHLKSWVKQLGADQCGEVAIEKVSHQRAARPPRWPYAQLYLSGTTGELVECNPDGDGGVLQVVHFRSAVQMRREVARDPALLVNPGCLDGRTYVGELLEFGLEPGLPSDEQLFEARRDRTIRRSFQGWCSRLHGSYRARQRPLVY